MQKHHASPMRLFTTRLIMGIGFLLAGFLVLFVQPSTAEQATVSLQKPLSDFDVGQYQRLFQLQEAGQMKQAVREAGRVDNDILMGHLLSKRYLILFNFLL